MATYIETYIEQIVQRLATGYGIVPVFDAEDANEKLDDPDRYLNNNAVIYNTFLNGSITTNVINKNYQTFSVLMWFLRLVDTENEPEQLAAKNAIRDDIHEFLQRFTDLDAFKKVPNNQTITANLDESYDKYDSLLVGTLVSFTVTIDVNESTCASFQDGPVSVFVVDQSDIDNSFVNASASTFRGEELGSTQGKHKWVFTLDATTVTIEGFSTNDLSSDDIALLATIGIDYISGNYSQFFFTKNDECTPSLRANIDVSHQFDGHGNGLLSEATTGIILSVSCPFITTWRVTDGQTITVPTTGTGYDYEVDWGDGSAVETGITGDATHTYTIAGDYSVSIKGNFPRIYFNNGGDKSSVINIEQWGDIAWESMEASFRGCNNLEYSAIDTPNLSGVTNMNSMFEKCTIFNGNIDSWDVGTITHIERLFQQANAFNQPLNSWNVSSVTNMDRAFDRALTFNQPLNNWDTSNALDMSNMFRVASAFNQDIGGWDVSNVTDMAGMFNSVTLIDQDFSNWNISNVTDMTGMFFGVTLSTTNYDLLLIGWAALTVQNNVAFDGGNSVYTSGGAAEAARDTLTNTYLWTITDGGGS